MMEILRFDSSGSTSTNGKKSSKGMLAIGLIATLFGIGSAFATTTSSITVNDGQNISIGQGITTFTTCDEFIAILPVTKLNTTATDFVLDKVVVGATYADDDKYKVNSTSKTDPASPGCGGVEFKVTFYEGTSKVDVCTNNGFNTPSVTGAFPVRCEASSIFFSVEIATDSYEIEFDDSVGTGFFDRISLETV
jgi:hypothetical protein